MSKALFVVRSARSITVALLAGALVFSGTGIALAEGEPPAPGADESSTTPSEQPKPPVDTPPPAENAPPPAAPAPPAETLPSETPPSETPPAQTPDPVTPEPQEDALPPASNAPTPPALRWRTIDGSGAVVAGAIITLQGPRDPAVVDLGNHEQWAAASQTQVTDNTGQIDYVGFDLDAAAGMFRVEKFADDGDTTATPVPVIEGRDYRVRAADATGFVVGDEADWSPLVVLTDDTILAQDVALKALTIDEKDAEDGVAPMLVTALPSPAPTCSAGNVYAISDAGQLQHISGGTRTNIGTSAGKSGMNGLGLAAGGNTVYAMKRTDNSTDAEIFTYNTTTGVWTSTGHSQATSVGLVAGAVNLSTGAYVFGGYSSDGSEFHLWSYSGGTFAKLGYIQTNMGSGSNNGDIAFNAAGDAFVVHGRGNSVTVFSITSANFAGASGGLITSARSATIATNSSDVNGVAFDAAGKGFLGSTTEIRSYDMPGWTNPSLVTSNLDDSTDLASCSSPATITLQKVVQGRAVASDQFTLSLQQGATVLGTATTAGTATGIQPQIVGPLPVVRGSTLTFTEAFSAGAVATNYATSYQCLVDGHQMTPAVTGTSVTGSITIPTSGEAIVCEFVNSPLTASVVITKLVQDTAGNVPAPAAGWTVNAETEASNGTVTASPAQPQQTDGSGNAAWSLRFSTTQTRAAVTVSEVPQSGYEFASGLCTLTPSVGAPIEVALTGPDPQTILDLAPGGTLACTYVNRELAGSISWQKVTNDTPAVHIGGSTWSVQGPGASGATKTVADCIGATAADCAAELDTDERAGYLKLVGLAWGEYTITETIAPPGFELDSTPHLVTVDASNAEAGASIDPVVNQRVLGTVTWSKVIADTTTLLGGSSWTITGPGFSAPNNAVEDCVAATDAACSGLDKDHVAGKFRMIDLAWGTYTLVESVAPLGYVLDTTPHSFTISAATSQINLEAFENTLSTPPTLPLTGGLGRDLYALLGLGVLLLSALLLAARRGGFRSVTKGGRDETL